jgi:hypothetical protein
MPILKRASIYNIPYFNITWDNDQRGKENMDRMLPLYYIAISVYPELKTFKVAQNVNNFKQLYDVEPLFKTHDGIAPFWNLAFDHDNIEINDINL